MQQQRKLSTTEGHDNLSRHIYMEKSYFYEKLYVLIASVGSLSMNKQIQSYENHPGYEETIM